MKRVINIFFFTILSFILCIDVYGQNNVSNNEIYRDANSRVGVKSISGEIIIEPSNTEISIINSNSKPILPPNAKLEQVPLEYYRVIDSLGWISIFKSDGTLLFDFEETINLTFDEHTQTAVTSRILSDNRIRYSLYNMDNEKIFVDDYKSINYVLNSDLIVLEKERREIYLYNPFTKSSLGPYDLVRVYDEHFDPTMGLPNIKHNKITKQVGIAVIINDYEWGFVDSKGNIALPISYKDLKTIPYDMYERVVLRAEKPEGVNFVFYGYPISGARERLFFDEDLNVYEYDTSSRTNAISGKITLVNKK